MNKIIRKLSFLAVLLTFIPTIAGATVDDEINRMEESRYAALIGKDWNALDGILADNFFYNTAGGVLKVRRVSSLLYRTWPGWAAHEGTLRRRDYKVKN